ncbi:hypothetical protein [Methylobacterium nonmethylotrophicum]|uniref:Uncharacterized protein n=1 Tax=Methylobacterium nonmethylotrophicum TaxID=1141884 RepID=A0A4Z0NGN5_9HYPH|nr:hypothetical protein [Methylobacterium nonmethylotrophicum]TGD94917.1 hypothetical protein EU555_30565 [Methylobacterium nonmethylotrophicum]
MATRHSTAPARAGERSRSPSSGPLYAYDAPTLSTDELDTTDAWEAVQPVRPDTPHVRALRLLNATGELLAAVAIIAGGITLYGVLRPF